ncbi:MAG: hypothetical protein WAK82_26460 [Streptosporangiaceae bacterium]
MDNVVLFRGRTAPRSTARGRSLVANNPYRTGRIAGWGRRVRLDRGVLRVTAVTVNTARHAAGLSGNRHAAGLSALTTQEIDITADAAEITVGVDGGALPLPAPVTCPVSPGVLHIWVPRNRAGGPAPKPSMKRSRLRHLADVCGEGAGDDATAVGRPSESALAWCVSSIRYPLQAGR